MLLAGCGDDGDDGGNRLSKAEFLEKGNAICEEGTQEIDAAGQTAFASPGHPTQQETAAFAEQTVVPSVQSQIDQLRDLSPPEDDQAQVTAILDQAQVAVDGVRANPQSLGQETDSAKANALAKAYGLTACAN